MVEIKGIPIIDSLEAVRRRDGQEALDRITQQLDGDAKRLMEAKLLPNAWYSLDAFAKFLEVDVRLTAGGNESLLVGRAEAVVEHQLRGVYKVFARLSSPHSILKRLATIHSTYFRNAEVRFESTGERQAIVEYGGFMSQHRIMRPVLVGFYRKALEVCGAKAASVSFLPPGPDGAPSWALRLTWR
jgi:hypothetical protein